MTPETKIAEVRAEYDSLKSCRMATLKELVSRSHRVVDLRGTDKNLLIGMILEAKFGRKAVEAAF